MPASTLLLRLALTTGGGLLTLAGLLTFWLPVPVGIPLLLIGLPLLLRGVPGLRATLERWLGPTRWGRTLFAWVTALPAVPRNRDGNDIDSALSEVKTKEPPGGPS